MLISGSQTFWNLPGVTNSSGKNSGKIPNFVKFRPSKAPAHHSFCISKFQNLERVLSTHERHTVPFILIPQVKIPTGHNSAETQFKKEKAKSLMVSINRKIIHNNTKLYGATSKVWASIPLQRVHYWSVGEIQCFSRCHYLAWMLSSNTPLIQYAAFALFALNYRYDETPSRRMMSTDIRLEPFWCQPFIELFVRGRSSFARSWTFHIRIGNVGHCIGIFSM